MAASSTLVLFDIDGTLLKGAGTHHRDALLEGVRRITGCNASFDGIDTAGTLDHNLISLLLRDHGPVDHHMDAIVAECQIVFTMNCTADLSGFVCQGAREVLCRLQARGAVLGLVTGNLSRIAWHKMELAGLREFFSVGAFSEDGSTRAHLVQCAVERARNARLVTHDCRVSHIGDHRNDIEAAKANGFQAVAVASGVMSCEDLRTFQPDILVENLAQLDIARLF
ncbi:MAG TPA: HAD family hydrolase [Bryobacteraceae bacterium]|nr:HAD family hydrolase [Bryobacteraceae bacterium]